MVKPEVSRNQGYIIVTLRCSNTLFYVWLAFMIGLMHATLREKHTTNMAVE